MGTRIQSRNPRSEREGLEARRLVQLRGQKSAPEVRAPRCFHLVSRLSMRSLHPAAAEPLAGNRLRARAKAAGAERIQSGRFFRI
jgi:hypothetical protein